MIRKFVILAATVPLLASACATTNQGVRGAAVGAGVGAVAGAAIGNNVGDGDAQRGALIGAAVGAAGGALLACRRPGGCGHSANNPNHSELYYDQFSGRYWYQDYRDGSTWWQNGQPRTAARGR